MGQIGFTLITADAKSPIPSRPYVYINLTSWGGRARSAGTFGGPHERR